jgi:outer membrane protein TolC
LPLPVAGLPADLLAKRPDVRAAGLRLKGADWSVAAAKADRLPSLTLSAEAALSSANLGLLLNNWLATLAAAITGPVFDGGYRKAEVERTRARAEQMLAEYGQVVLEAIQEVEDGLANEFHQREYLDRLSEELAAARQAQVQAQLHYVKGATDYLSVLTETLSAQALERTLVREKADLVKYRVALHRVLGGGWTHSLEQPAPDQTASDARQ